MSFLHFAGGSDKSKHIIWRVPSNTASRAQLGKLARLRQFEPRYHKLRPDDQMRQVTLRPLRHFRISQCYQSEPRVAVLLVQTVPELLQCYQYHRWNLRRTYFRLPWHSVIRHPLDTQYDLLKFVKIIAVNDDCYLTLLTL